MSRFAAAISSSKTELALGTIRVKHMMNVLLCFSSAFWIIHSKNCICLISLLRNVSKSVYVNLRHTVYWRKRVSFFPVHVFTTYIHLTIFVEVISQSLINELLTKLLYQQRLAVTCGILTTFIYRIVVI